MTEPLPDFGGCPWPLDPGCLEADWEQLTPDQELRFTILASNTLHRLTGGRVGGCPITIRPCSQVTCGGAFVPFTNGGRFSPGMNVAGAWVNNACGSCSSCTGSLCEVELPGPVGRVDEVRVNGTVLASTDYEVQNGRFLVYTGSGACPFPATQDLSKATTEAGTFSVTYLNAYPVDLAGAYAAGIMAMEFSKACSVKGARNCRLPASVISVVRAGVSYEIRPGLFPDGFTGIDEVDSFISDWNPRALAQDSTIWSPGMPEPRITTSGGA